MKDDNENHCNRRKILPIKCWVGEAQKYFYILPFRTNKLLFHSRIWSERLLLFLFHALNDTLNNSLLFLNKNDEVHLNYIAEKESTK